MGRRKQLSGCAKRQKTAVSEAALAHKTVADPAWGALELGRPGAPHRVNLALPSLKPQKSSICSRSIGISLWSDG